MGKNILRRFDTVLNNENDRCLDHCREGSESTDFVLITLQFAWIRRIGWNWQSVRKQWSWCYFIKINILIDWLIDNLVFYVPLKNVSLICRRHHYRWKAAKFRPMLGALGLWAGRDLYRATLVVTQDLGFSGLIWRTAPFSHLLRHTRGCGGPILTQILTGLHILMGKKGYSLVILMEKRW
jgi:hypothetical protein